MFATQALDLAGPALGMERAATLLYSSPRSWLIPVEQVGSRLRRLAIHLLSVQVKAAQTTVKNNEKVSVSTTIRNSGLTETRIVVWACAFPSEWTVDSPSIDIYQPNCLAENRTWINLKRGEAYRSVVRVHVRAVNLDQKEVTFRMGFGNRLFSDDQKHLDEVAYSCLRSSGTDLQFFQRRLSTERS